MNRRWRLIEVLDGAEDDLTDDELFAMSVVLTHHYNSDPIHLRGGNYWLGRNKIHPQVESAQTGAPWRSATYRHIAGQRMCEKCKHAMHSKCEGNCWCACGGVKGGE